MIEGAEVLDCSETRTERRQRSAVGSSDCEMNMGVDHPGHDREFREIDHPGSSWDCPSWTHLNDPLALDQDECFSFQSALLDVHQMAGANREQAVLRMPL